MAVKRQKSKPISVLVVVMILIISAVGGLFYMPSRRKLLERQVADNQVSAAWQTFQEIPAWQKQKDPVFYLATELHLKHRRMAGFKSAQFDDLLITAYQGCVTHNFDPQIVELVIRFTATHPRPERALELGRPWIPQFPSRYQEEIIDRLVDGFRAANEPQLAAELYQQFYNRVVSTENRIFKLARWWEEAGHPDKASDQVNEFMKDLEPETVPRIARRQIHLFRAANRQVAAFEACYKLFYRSDLKSRADLYELLVKTASEVSRVAEIIEEVVKKAEEFPDNLEKWLDLRDLATAAGRLDLAVYGAEGVVRLAPNVAEHSFKHGQLLEWSDRAADAFAAYIPAVSAEHDEAWDRYLALAFALFRELEAAELLASMPAVVERRQLEHQMAQLNEKCGFFEEAERWYQLSIERHPTNIFAFREYGRFLLGLYEYEKALGVFTRALELAPDDVWALSGLSETHYRLGNFEEAHDILASAADRTGNEELLNQLISLAEAMQRTDTLISALEKKIARGGSPNDIKQLAFAYQRMGRSVELVEVLKAGLLKYPDDPVIRIRLATFLSEREDYVEAIRVLEGSSLITSHREAKLLYISLLVQAQQFDRAEKFFKQYVPLDKPDLTPAPVQRSTNPRVRLVAWQEEVVDPTPGLLAIRQNEGFLALQAMIAEGFERYGEAEAVWKKLHESPMDKLEYGMNYARILAHNGKLLKAMAVYKKYSDVNTSTALKLKAQFLAAAGKFRDAEEMQKQYLESKPSDLAKAFGFLGDLRLSRGNRIEAKRAFERGLNTMLEEANKSSIAGAPKVPAATIDSKPLSSHPPEVKDE